MMKKNIFKFILIFLLFGFKNQATATSVDSLQHIFKAALINPINPLDTLGDPLRLLGDRSMVDAYKEQNNSGIENKAEADLKAAAVALVAAIPPAIAADFKVYDYTAYSLIGRFKEPEKWNNWVFNTMDSLVRNKYNTQYYLLIAKEINPSDGKVRFRVKLSLPTVAGGNRPSGDRSNPNQYPATLVWKWQETFKKVMEDYLFKDPGYGHYEAHELEGLITLTKMIKEGEGLDHAAWYRPDGYIINRPTGHYVDAIISAPREYSVDIYKNGFVYGWVFLDKDTDGKTTYEATYKAVIKGNQFYGYYLNGIMDETNPAKDRFTESGNVNKGEEIAVGAVDYITEKCGGVEWRDTRYKQITTDYPPYPTSLKEVITDNSNLPQGFGYLSESPTRKQFFYVCATGKADTYERYFLFKLHKDNNTPETRKAITDFCLEIAKYDEFFKSSSVAFKGKYVYYINSSFTVGPRVVTESGSNLEYLKFIELVFLSNNSNNWKKETFELAKKEVGRYVALQTSELANGGKDIATLISKTKISKGVDNILGEEIQLFNLFEYSTTINKLQYIKSSNFVGKFAKPILMHTNETGILNLIDGIQADNIFWERMLVKGSSNGLTIPEKEDNMIIAQFLTSQKIKLIAENKVTSVKPAFEVPFNVMDILAGTTVNSFDKTKLHYDIKFNQAYWIETEYVIKYLPFTGGYQKNDTAWVSTNQILPNNNLAPLDLILVRASNEAFKGLDDKSLYSQFKMGDDFYLISPFLIDIEHRLDNSKRAAAYTEAAVTAISIVALVPEIQAARVAALNGQFIKCGIKSVYVALDIAVLAVNLIDDIGTNDQKAFINNSYLLISLFRVAGNLAFNAYLKSPEGQAMLTQYFNQCDNMAGSSGNSLAKRIATRMLTEYGHLKPGACFTAGTPIAAKDGLKPIEKVKKDDWVYSWDFSKKVATLQRVVRTFERTTNQLVHLFIGKDTIHTTPEHPFFVPNDDEQVFASTESNVFNKKENGSWILAKNLRKGTKVLLFSSLLATVDSTFAQYTICPVYNFEVANTHNYFVGKERVLVHNSCDIDDLINAIKSDGYYDKLEISYRGRYDALFTAAKNEKDAVKLKELKARLSRGAEIKALKKALPADYFDIISNRNLMFGKYKMKYNGKVIEENFIVVSGHQNIYTQMPSEILIEGIKYKIITKTDYGQTFLKETNVFKHAENIGQAAHDTELKFYRYLSVKAKTNFGLSIADDTNEFKKIEGSIEFISEQAPCNSCVGVMDTQAKSYFGNNMPIPSSKDIPFVIPTK